MSRNLPLFIIFRLLFNARFYYPVFAVIQLDALRHYSNNPFVPVFTAGGIKEF